MNYTGGSLGFARALGRDGIADVCNHEELKASVQFFVAGTERLPHMPDVEAVQDGLLYRNCIRCRSTLVLEVEHGLHYHVLVGYLDGDRKFFCQEEAIFSDRLDAVTRCERVRRESAEGWVTRMHACALGCEE